MNDHHLKRSVYYFEHSAKRFMMPFLHFSTVDAQCTKCKCKCRGIGGRAAFRYTMSFLPLSAA